MKSELVSVKGAGRPAREAVILRAWRPTDLVAMRRLWNAIVAAGDAFPQEEPLGAGEAGEFFAAQTHCGVALLGRRLVGLYILHPNNVGRCGHIANASYAVLAGFRGRHIGEALVRDSLCQAKRLGFRILQFNAVVAGNVPARRLYEKLGFTPLGRIPGGFCLSGGAYTDIIPFFRVL